MRNCLKFAAVAFGLAVSVAASAQVAFNVIAVPQSPANSFTAINNSSQVVANGDKQTSGDVAVWSRTTGFEDLGLSGANAAAAAMNDSGEVVGAGNPEGSGAVQAFVFGPGTGVQCRGSRGGVLSAASGVNESGTVVGLSYTAAKTQHAFLWTPESGMEDLTPQLQSIGGATAVGVNSANEVAGYYFSNGDRNPVAFLWTAAGGLQNLAPAGAIALGINDAGTIVGQAPNARGFKHACAWSSTGQMTDLGTLGGATSSALAINNRGWIVGTSLTISKKGLLRVFLWTPSAGMQDLATLAGVSKQLQPYSLQVNDYGVIAVSTNKGISLYSPLMRVALTSSANPSKVAQPVTFTATVGSIAGAPQDGEAVTFKIAGQVVGSATLVNGVAQFTTAAIPKGAHIVSAEYAGDANYLASPYTALHQVVNP